MTCTPVSRAFLGNIQALTANEARPTERPFKPCQLGRRSTEFTGGVDTLRRCRSTLMVRGKPFDGAAKRLLISRLTLRARAGPKPIQGQLQWSVRIVDQ